MYFLGEITDEYYDFIRSTMEENNINEVFDFFDESKSHFVEKGPSEFINLIDNAEYVLQILFIVQYFHYYSIKDSRYLDVSRLVLKRCLDA